jgi:hypothetical protein
LSFHKGFSNAARKCSKESFRVVSKARDFSKSFSRAGKVSLHEAARSHFPFPTTIRQGRQGKPIMQASISRASVTGYSTPPLSWSPWLCLDLGGRARPLNYRKQQLAKFLNTSEGELALQLISLAFLLRAAVWRECPSSLFRVRVSPLSLLVRGNSSLPLTLSQYLYFKEALLSLRSLRCVS